MNLEVNGVEYTNFTTASCEIRLDALSNTFRFDAIAPQQAAMPFKGGDSCKVKIDGETVLTGFIEVISVRYDGSDHSISISGRDKTADLLDSNLDAVSDIRADGLTLKSLIEKIIGIIGADIQVIDEVNPPPFSELEDIASPEAGDGAFEFIQKYAKKRQVLLTSNGEGNLVIASNSGQKVAGAVQHIIGAEDNNVISAEFSFDTTGRYNLYKITSSMNPVTANEGTDTDLAGLVNQGNSISDTEVRAGRLYVAMADETFSEQFCKDRATWEADIRKARGLIYSATVPFYRVGGTTGDLWQINKLYQIVDDFLGKVEIMLCNAVTFNYDIDSGRTTQLQFVGKNAYTLSLNNSTPGEVASNVV